MRLLRMTAMLFVVRGSTDAYRYRFSHVVSEHAAAEDNTSGLATPKRIIKV